MEGGDPFSNVSRARKRYHLKAVTKEKKRGCARGKGKGGGGGLGRAPGLRAYDIRIKKVSKGELLRRGGDVKD